MKKMILFAALLFVSAAVGAEPFWKKDPNAVRVVAVEVTEVSNIGVWCGRLDVRGCARVYHPQALAGLPVEKPEGYRCAVYIDVRAPQEWKASIEEHEDCHCRGYEHEVFKPGERVMMGDPFNGWRPDRCPTKRNESDAPIVRFAPL